MKNASLFDKFQIMPVLLYLALLLICKPLFSQDKCRLLFNETSQHSPLTQTDWKQLKQAISLGEKIETQDPLKMTSQLLELLPDGFLVHGTSSVSVEEILNHSGRLNGSVSIESQYWMRSREFDHSAIRGLKNLRTVYFYDSHNEKSLVQALKYASYYADNSSSGFYLLRSLGLDINEFAPIAHNLSEVAHGDFLNLKDLRDYVRSYYPHSKISLMDKLIKETGEPSKSEYTKARNLKGVLIIFNRRPLNRLSHYPDPETSGSFFLLNGEQYLSIKDIELIVPLSPNDKINLNDN